MCPRKPSKLSKPSGFSISPALTVLGTVFDAVPAPVEVPLPAFNSHVPFRSSGWSAQEDDDTGSVAVNLSLDLIASDSTLVTNPIKAIKRRSARMVRNFL